MEMTIEERIAQLVRVKHYASPRHYETLDTAISTMRKYQKIEQILQESCIIPEGCYPMLKKIKEVVDNGNER